MKVLICILGCLTLQNSEITTDKASAKESLSGSIAAQTRKRAADHDFSEPEAKKPINNKSTHVERVSL